VDSTELKEKKRIFKIDESEATSG